MTKATTIKEIYNIFAPEKFLKKENEEFYVDIYGEELRDFVTALENTEDEKKTFFMAGQSGNGKSTALNFLTTRNAKLEEIYNFKYIAGRTIFLYEDIDIVDILLMIGSAIVKDSDKLKKKYISKLQKIEDIKDGLREEASSTSTKSNKDLSLKANLRAKAKFLSMIEANMDLEASYRINKEIRIEARKFFKIRRKELIDLTNEIILAHQKENDNAKKLLIVIDDLEKKDNIDELFIKDMPLLNELDIVKIITMPIHLHRMDNFPSSDIREFGLKFKSIDGDINTNDKNLLKEIISKRIDGDIIAQEAIEKAVEYSGANLRQLIKLVHISAEKVLGVDGKRIDVQDIESAKDRIQRDYSSKVMMMLSFLNEIVDGKMMEDNVENLDNLAKATRMELIFARFNGITWFELNPICEKSLAMYNKLRN